MSPERPEYVDPMWCPDCGAEMAFVGVNNIYAQFLCDTCKYRWSQTIDVEDVQSRDAADASHPDVPAESD